MALRDINQSHCSRPLTRKIRSGVAFTVAGTVNRAQQADVIYIYMYIVIDKGWENSSFL